MLCTGVKYRPDLTRFLWVVDSEVGRYEHCSFFSSAGAGSA